MNDGAKIGDYIREQRTKLGMSISDVADASGTPEATIKGIASNKTANPGFWTVAGIVEAVDGSLDDLAGIKQKKDEDYEEKISALGIELKKSNRDYDHSQANVESLKRFLEDREKTIKWLRREIIVISCVALALIILMFSILMYDIRHPSIGYFQDDAGNIYPYSTGDEHNQDRNNTGDTITTSFEAYINE